jgi:hypothetical protein
MVRACLLAILAVGCSSQTPPGEAPQTETSATNRLFKPLAEQAKRVRDAASAKGVQFDLFGTLAEFDEEATLAPEAQLVTISERTTISRAVDALCRCNYEYLASEGPEDRVMERTHRLDVVGSSGQWLLGMEFYDEDELRSRFPDSQDADFMAGLFRRAVKEALAKSKKQGEEE